MELIRFSTFETTDINLISKDLHVFPRETVCYWAMQNQCSSSEVWLYLLVEHKRMADLYLPKRNGHLFCRIEAQMRCRFCRILRYESFVQSKEPE